MIFECVINVSEGKDKSGLEKIADFVGKEVIDIHSDNDHNRTVYTLASRNLNELKKAAQALTSKVFEDFTFDGHIGVHPRLGLIDVVPFVSYDEVNFVPTNNTIKAAIDFGTWAKEKFGVEIYFYDFASESKTTLPSIRKRESTNLKNAICVGARPPLVAINVNIQSSDLSFAKSIAKNIRESSGGLPGVRAIGLELPSKNIVQVSMNIVDLEIGNTENASFKIKEIAEGAGKFSEVELVGLVPRFHYDTWSDKFLEWSGLTPTCTVENRLE